MTGLFCAAHEHLVAQVAGHLSDMRVLDALRALFVPEDPAAMSSTSSQRRPQRDSPLVRSMSLG